MLIDSQLLTKLEKLSMLQIENKDNMIDSLTSILDFPCLLINDELLKRIVFPIFLKLLQLNYQPFHC
jgi:hypothetical protein